MSAPMSSEYGSSQMGLKSFSLLNDVNSISLDDQLFQYDSASDALINREAPWKKELVYLV